MAAEAKALLDELMGRTRNLDPSQQPEDLRWDSADVCKHFLCGFCPHELFTNTRADLGPCNKIHDEVLRKEYTNDAKFEKCGYEEDFIRFLNSLINDVEKRIRRGHQRLSLNSQQGTLNGSPPNQHEEKEKLLTEKINQLVEQAEELGCEGKVEEAQGMMKLADQLKEERTQLQNQPTPEDGPMMKQMEVCEVCGAFLIVGDAPQRQDEHLMGKQHAGYAQVRAEVDKRKQKARDEIATREANEQKLKQEREEREQERIREREERRQKEREKELEREKERERKRRGSRSRSRDRRRSRSRDRRRRRSGSRDRKQRSRSRDRDRRRRSRSGSRSRRSSRRSSSRDKKVERRRSRDRRSRSRHRTRSKDRKSREEKDGKSNGSDKKTQDKRKEDKDYGSPSESQTRSTDNQDADGSSSCDAGQSGGDGGLGDEIGSCFGITSDGGGDKQGSPGQAGDGTTLSEGDTKMDE